MPAIRAAVQLGHADAALLLIDHTGGAAAAGEVGASLLELATKHRR